GFVLREELEVIFQRHQVVLANFRIRGIGVLHVDRTLGQRSVAESMIDADDVWILQLVFFSQRPPAIATIEKFVSEPESQFGMTPQVADLANPFLFRCY